MYNDYPTIYETTINENLIYYIILSVILLIIIIVMLISLAKIYKKANRSAISAIIPFYNLFVLLEIVNLPKWYFIPILIPGVNLIFYVIIMLSLSRLFRKSKWFGLGLAFLPFIFYPILAFNKSEYIGLNIAAIDGKTIVEEEIKVKEEKELTVNEEIDEKSRNINISIGGGVYQKDYTKDLLRADDDKTIYNQNNTTKPEIIPKAIPEPSFITNIINDELPKEEKKDISLELQNQLSQVKPVSEIKVEEPVKPKIEIKPLENYTPTRTNDFVNSNIQNPQTTPSNEYIICPKCGTQLKSNSSACFICGNKLK